MQGLLALDQYGLGWLPWGLGQLRDFPVGLLDDCYWWDLGALTVMIMFLAGVRGYWLLRIIILVSSWDSGNHNPTDLTTTATTQRTSDVMEIKTFSQWVNKTGREPAVCQARFVGIIIIIFLSSTLSRYSAVSAPLILVLWSVPLNRLKVILNYRKYDTIILFGPLVPSLIWITEGNLVRISTAKTWCLRPTELIFQ